MAPSGIARLNKMKAARRAKKQPVTIAAVKRLISNNVDKVRADSLVVSSSNITTTCTVTSIVGGTLENRVLDDLHYRVRITNPTLNTVVRIIFFQWKDSTLPIDADILASVSNPLSTLGPTTDSQRNCGGKLHLLADMMIPMNTTTQNIKSFKLSFYKKKLLPLKSPGDSTSELRNEVFIAYLSDTAVTPPVLTVYQSYVYHQN